MAGKSKIDLDHSADTPDYLIKEYRALADDLAKYLSDSESVYLRIRNRRGIISVSIGTLDINEDFSGKITANRIFQKIGGQYRLENSYLTIDPSLRGKSISDRINLAGARSLKNLGGRYVETQASLSSGGYVWLRKGFWPNEGKRALDDIARDAARESKAMQGVADMWLSMSEAESQEVMLDRIRARVFADLFAGSQWKGQVDIENERQLNAFIGTPSDKTASEYLTGSFVARQIDLEDISDSLAYELIDLLKKGQNVLEQRIAARLTVGKNNTVTERLLSMQAIISGIRNEQWAKVIERMRDQSIELALSELEWLDQSIKAALPVEVTTVWPSKRQLSAIVSKNPFAGETLNSWLSKARQDDLRRIRSAIQIGITLGDDVRSMTNRLFGELASSGSASQMTFAQLRSLVRTAVHNIANQTRQAYIQENKHLIEKEKFVSTLDSRTSDICKINDGKLFNVGEGPMPPLHFNCRSTRIPYFSESIVSRPSNGYARIDALEEFSRKNKLRDISDYDDLPKGYKGKFVKFEREYKRSVIGQIPSEITYSSWIKRQTPAFQKLVLGEKRYALLNKGNLTLKDFIRTDGRRIPLSELFRKHKREFDLAGITP